MVNNVCIDKSWFSLDSIVAVISLSMPFSETSSKTFPLNAASSMFKADYSLEKSLQVLKGPRHKDGWARLSHCQEGTCLLSTRNFTLCIARIV